MATTDTIRVDGLKELDRALFLLGKTTGGKALRGALFDSTLVMFKAARSNAAATGVRGHDADALAAAMSRWVIVRDKRRIEVFIGPRAKSKKGLAVYNDLHDRKIKGLHHGHLTEFGSKNSPVQPFMRPAFDSTKSTVPIVFGRRLKKRIDKITAAR